MSTTHTSRGVRRLAGVLATVGLVSGGLTTGVSASSAATNDATDVTGIDISAYQHNTPIDWTKVAAAEDFVVVKATEGATHPNSHFAADMDAAMAKGMIVGSYHFAYPQAPLESDAKSEANYYFKAAGSRHGKEGVLPPVLDIEKANGLSASELQTWVKAFLVEAERLFGQKPMIYTGSSFGKTYLNTSTFGAYKLWLAHYGVSSPSVPSAWPSWDMWQYTDDATVSGISGGVDRNYFDGTLAELEKLAGGSGTTDPPAPAARDGRCDDGEMCLYYRTDHGGSVSDFNTSIPDNGLTAPRCYDFKSAGDGQGECVRNNTASVWNRTGKPVSMYVYTDYRDPKQVISAGAKVNLNTTLKNNNAAHRIG